jgi:very-short-patch-repair endonuclease
MVIAEPIMRGIRIPEARRSRALRRDQTEAERRLWSKLRNRQLAGCKFVRQEPVGPYFVDLLCREHRLIVEVDGATHSTDEEKAYDARRTAFLEREGYKVVRFTNAEVYENMDGVLETLFNGLQLSDAMRSTDQPLTPALSPLAGRGS